jgi:gamma-glutamyl hercynylcysteine S-oxide synthase
LNFKSVQSLRSAIFDDLQTCRSRTLDLVNEINSIHFYTQAHPDFSPIGWHLGHIAFTEALWILERCAGFAPQFREYHKLFSADGLPKEKRQILPNLEEILNYLETIRTQVLEYLETAPLEIEERLWNWLLQHESQHNETMTFLLQIHRWSNNYSTFNFSPHTNHNSLQEEMIEIPGGEFIMGSNTVDAQDNERPLHSIYLETFYLDPYPVTCQKYRQFMEAGGYKNPQFWSEKGWQWLQTNPVNQPLYWLDAKGLDLHPVCGVSWYEAEAFCNFVGKRLPTEAEWEKAASWDTKNGQKYTYPWGNTIPNYHKCNYDHLVGNTTPVNAYSDGKSPGGCYDLLGNVWEWTNSWFAGYTGFQMYPYSGYSQVYFDQQHRVLRGGSWGTRFWGLRSSFRNWYHPHVRQIFVGFRCAKD